MIGKGKRIIVSVTNDLVTDQRVQKVCKTLYEEGYLLTLIGRELNKSLPLEREYKVKRIKCWFNKKFVFYAEFNVRLFFILLFSKADLFLSNDVDTLLANFLASRLRKKRLVFDAHELFSESPEINNKPFVRKVWVTIEKLILPHVKYSYTVCDSIAKHYSELYGLDMQVVRNVPYKRNYEKACSEVPVVIQNNRELGNRIIIYQGVVNFGRGLEWLIEAMDNVTKAVFLIIGDGDIALEIKDKIDSKGLQDKIVMVGRKTPDELLSFTKSSDLGVNLLKEIGLNQYYALPNRIFDYIHAEIPVLTTDFPEISRIVTEYKTGRLINHYEPEYLSGVLNEMLDNIDEYKKEACFKKAKHQLCWESEKDELLKLMNIAIE